jgi:hypothetical protein
MIKPSPNYHYFALYTITHIFHIIPQDIPICLYKFIDSTGSPKKMMIFVGETLQLWTIILFINYA